MRGRFLVLVGVLVLLLGSLFVGVSSANTWVKDTSLSIGKVPSGQTAHGAKVIIKGRLRHASCRQGKKIQLTKVRPGPDKVLRSDKTDADGEYSFILHPKSEMRVRARFRGSVESTYGGSHTCRKSHSSTVLIQLI